MPVTHVGLQVHGFVYRKRLCSSCCLFFMIRAQTSLKHLTAMIHSCNKRFKVVKSSEKAFVLCALVHFLQEATKHSFHLSSRAGANLKERGAWDGAFTGLLPPRVILYALTAVQPNCFIKVRVLSITVYGHRQNKEPMGLVKKSRELSLFPVFVCG